MVAQINMLKLAASPSALFNNLTGAVDSLFFSHAEQVVKVLLSNGISDLKACNSQAEASSLVQQVRLCQVEDFAVLVVARGHGLQVWDSTGSRLMFVWSLPPLASKPTATIMANFARGIAINAAADGSSQICIGSCSGAIHIFSIGQGGRISHSLELSGHQQPITCLGSSLQSRRGRMADDVTCLLVSADDEGTLVVWQATSAASYTVKQRIPGTGVPTVSVAVRGEYVFAAFMDGAVRVHSLADAKLRIELQAHSRYLSAMDVHPSKDIIVTAAEDCTVNVWSISPTLQVKLLFSQCWHNAMITGVIFCGQDSCMLAACAYDTDELKTWQLAM